MKLMPINVEFEEALLVNLSKQFSAINFRALLQEYTLYKAPKNHIYLIPVCLAQELQKFSDLAPVLRHAGIYFGRMRNDFGLSFEALFLFQKFYTELISHNQAVKLDSKQVKRFLYGKDVMLADNSRKYIPHSKLFIFDEYDEIIGLGEFIKIENETYIHPVVDLGMYLRYQDKKTFKK